MAKQKKYYTNNNKNFNDTSITDNTKTFIIILLVILGIIGSIWFIMEASNGTFSKKDSEENTNNETTIQYDEIMAGQTFNRSDSEYYVVFADSDKNFYNLYKSYASTSDIKIYLVDIGNTINERYVSDETNSSVQSSDELKVSDNTLIKIQDGKNVLYLEGYKNIIEELKK